MTDARAAAEAVDHNARNSSLLTWSVRVGLLAYGAVHFLIAFVAVRLALGGGGQSATGQGALAQLAADTVGRVALMAMAVAFAALVVWQLVAAAVGYRELDGWQRHVMRGGALARVATYGYFAWESAKIALQGARSSGGSPQSMTARVLHAPAGPFVLGAVGLVAAAIGIGLAVFGLRKGFLGQLDEQARTADRRIPIVVVGQVGYVVKGAAFVVVGGLLAWAGIARDPQKSGGLDQALYEVLGHTLGVVAVLVVGAGLACFGLYLFARSRHLDEDSLTS